MNSSYLSFLIQCDPQLNIVNALWYQPVTFLSPYQKSFPEIFVESDRNKIREVASQALHQDKILACEETFQVLTPEKSVSLCLMAMGDKLLIHGLEDSAGSPEIPRPVFRDLVHRFMQVVRFSDKEIYTESEQMIRSQFEQIQKLNNNLVNLQRQLQKTNHQLNRANQDLNNRLVKDALTGLVSRYQYREEIEKLIAADPDSKGIFVFIDLDEFKSINDTYGHRQGDGYLKAFAGCLNALPFDSKICIRIAGDEFGVYLHGYTSVTPEVIHHIWKMLIISANKICSDPNWNLPPFRCCAGMAVYGQDTRDIFDLIDYADFAMYQAKKSGKNTFRSFDRIQYLKEKAEQEKE